MTFVIPLQNIFGRQLGGKKYFDLGNFGSRHTHSQPWFNYDDDGFPPMTIIFPCPQPNCFSSLNLTRTEPQTWQIITEDTANRPICLFRYTNLMTPEVQITFMFRRSEHVKLADSHLMNLTLSHYFV